MHAQQLLNTTHTRQTSHFSFPSCRYGMKYPRRCASGLTLSRLKSKASGSSIIFSSVIPVPVFYLHMALAVPSYNAEQWERHNWLVP